MTLTWPQALAWRSGRHLLAPRGAGTVGDVVGRLGVVPAWPEAAAELAVGARRTDAHTGDVERALAAGEVIRTYLFRGATHLVTPRDAGIYLVLRSSRRQWELPSWQETYGLEPGDWPAFREAARAAVGDGALTREELSRTLGRRRSHRRAAAGLLSGTDTLLKALMWQGDLCFGPTRDGQPTLQRLDAVPGWAGLPDIDEAGLLAVESYLRAYGPAGPEHLQYWLGEGLSAGRKAIRGWLAVLDDRVVHVDVEGERLLVLADDADALARSSPVDPVRLLPGQDQWVMGPGTADPHVVPPARRDVVSRGANLLVAGGVVRGTWVIRASRLEVSWFEEQGAPDHGALAEEADRLAGFMDRELDLTVSAVPASVSGR